MIASLFLSLLAAEPDSAPALKAAIEKRPEVAGYLLCSAKKASELEPSGETAEAIATAALAACDSMIDFPVTVLTAEYDQVLRSEGKLPLSKDERMQFKQGALEKLRNGARSLAITTVVSKRANTRAPN